MFTKILSRLHAFEIAYRDDIISTRRRFMRREDSDAEVMVGGMPLDLRNWSFDGVLFETPKYDWNKGGAYYEPEPMPHLIAGDRLKIALRFHVLNETIEIPVDAEILRTGPEGTVAKFRSLPLDARRKFERVKDLQNAKGFLESQHPPRMVRGGEAYQAS